MIFLQSRLAESLKVPGSPVSTNSPTSTLGTSPANFLLLDGAVLLATCPCRIVIVRIDDGVRVPSDFIYSPHPYPLFLLKPAVVGDLLRRDESVTEYADIPLPSILQSLVYYVQFEDGSSYIRDAFLCVRPHGIFGSPGNNSRYSQLTG